jgi:hypothetical protein
MWCATAAGYPVPFPWVFPINYNFVLSLHIILILRNNTYGMVHVLG